MQETHISFYSHNLCRNIDVVSYGHWGLPILLFPSSMGDAFQNKNFGLIDSVSDKIEQGLIKIYCVGSIDNDSFYAKHLPPKIRISNYKLYNHFLLRELIPYFQKESKTHRIGIGGCSFGAYHAANFAFKHPELVHFLIAMSGSFNISSFLDGYYDDDVYFNNPIAFIPNSENWTYNHMQIVLGTSDWDICKEDNIQLSRILGDKQINHWYDEKKWITHDWPLWKMMFPEYISTFL
jgi:esterase/lipase superfamily enzyme